MLKLVRLMIMVMLPMALNAQDLSLESIWLKYNYRVNTGDRIQFQNTNANYTQLVYDKGGSQKLNLYDIASGKLIETLYDGSKIDRDHLFISNYEFSSNDKLVLLATAEEPIFRRSLKANYYAYNIDTDEFLQLSDQGKQMYPHFSPDNKSVAFIRNNNLFYKSLHENKEVQITFDGEINQKINGYADWVYEEEFMLTRAYEWSARGDQILFIQFDESTVKEYEMQTYRDLYPETTGLKYPKAGEQNSKESLQLYDLKTEQLHTLNIPFSFEYIPRIYATDYGFAFLLLNRHQNHLQLVSYNTKNDQFNIIYEEKDERYVDVPIVLQYLSGNNWVISSEKDGYTHLYTIINQHVKAITKGNFEVTDYYGMNTSGWVFYQSAEENETERQVYKINIHTDEKIALTAERGSHSATFSGDSQFFIDNHSADGLPYQISVKESDKGKKIRSIEENKELLKQIKSFWSYKDFFEIPLGEYSLNAWMIKPKNFDPSKKYPVVMMVYGGPGDQNVQNTWGGLDDFWFQILAQKDFIVVSVDNRGTGMKGSEFKKMTYAKLGQYEVEDQIKAAQYLGGLPYIDQDKIGIWGWSYGGYVSAFSLFEGQGIFKAAISIAPIANWRFYNTVYAERYLGLLQENMIAYETSSLLNAVPKWKTGSLFLAHGMLDDNVHFQNSVKLVEFMNYYGKQYDFYCYPDSDHNIGTSGNRYHLYTKMTNFLLEHLMNE
ncbi:MAG: DPP IV N-terminal domain-containing protein [Chitinophagales bacterium]